MIARARKGSARPAPAPASPFRSRQGRHEYLAAYDSVLDGWPVSHQALDLPTSFGTTHLNVCGDRTSPPLVILPGAAMSSTQWYPNVASLSRTHRVYALDEIGDMGRSVATRKPGGRDDYARWLGETLDRLAIGKAAVMGFSHGGWIAMWFAMSHPDRVASLTVLDPAASLNSLPLQFYLRAIPVLLLRNRGLARNYLGWFFAPGHTVPARLSRQWTAGWQHFKTQQAPPLVFTDVELQKIAAPTLVLIGSATRVYSSRDAAVSRARRLIPNAEVQIVRDAGHMMSIEQADDVNAKIESFLSSTTGG